MSNSEDVDELFRAIGMLSVSWAHLEGAIDIWITQMHTDYGGSDLGLERPRTSFKRKANYIIEFITKTEFKNSIPEFIFIFQKLKEKSKIRNDLIHGAAVMTEISLNNEFEVSSFVPDQHDGFQRTIRKVNIADIRDLAKEVHLAAVTIHFYISLFDGDEEHALYLRDGPLAHLRNLLLG